MREQRTKEDNSAVKVNLQPDVIQFLFFLKKQIIKKHEKVPKKERKNPYEIVKNKILYNEIAEFKSHNFKQYLQTPYPADMLHKYAHCFLYIIHVKVIYCHLHHVAKIFPGSPFLTEDTKTWVWKWLARSC